MTSSYDHPQKIRRPRINPARPNNGNSNGMADAMANRDLRSSTTVPAQTFGLYPNIANLVQTSQFLPRSLQHALGKKLFSAAITRQSRTPNSRGRGSSSLKSMGPDAVLNIYQHWYNTTTELDRAFKLIAELPPAQQSAFNRDCGDILHFIHLYQVRRCISPTEFINLISDQLSNTPH